MPGTERLVAASVIGERGRQAATMNFDGPFEMVFRQSQVAPLFNPDPAGTASTRIELLPGVRALLIERNDGSSRAVYQLFWDQNGIYYELLANGPPLQRHQILRVARSLQ